MKTITVIKSIYLTWQSCLISNCTVHGDNVWSCINFHSSFVVHPFFTCSKKLSLFFYFFLNALIQLPSLEKINEDKPWLEWYISHIQVWPGIIQNFARMLIKYWWATWQPNKWIQWQCLRENLKFSFEPFFLTEVISGFWEWIVKHCLDFFSISSV